MTQKWKCFLFAGGSTKEACDFIIDKQCGRLHTQFNERKLIENFWADDRAKNLPLVVDSGAYSAANSGKVINLDDYIAWINKNSGNTNTHFVELDVTPLNDKSEATLQKTAQQSWDNYLYMVERVKNPDKILPVYHAFEDISNLDRILNTPVLGPNKYPSYIFIGGIANFNATSLYDKFDNIFDHIKRSKNPDVNVHALGISNFKFLQAFPFYTSDSTSWIKFGAYGSIKTPFGDFYCGRENISNKKQVHIKFLPSNIQQPLEDYLQKNVGIGIQDIVKTEEESDNSMDKQNLILKINISYYKWLSDNYVYTPRKNLTKKLF